MISPELAYQRILSRVGEMQHHFVYLNRVNDIQRLEKIAERLSSLLAYYLERIASLKQIEKQSADLRGCVEIDWDKVA